MSQSTSVNQISNVHSKAYTSEDSAIKSKALGGLGSPSDINGDGSIDDLENYAYDLKMWIAEQRDNGVQLSAEDMNTIQGYIDYCSSMLGGWDPLAELGWSPTSGGFPEGDYSDYSGSEGPIGNQTIIDGGAFSVDGSVETTDVWGTAETPAEMSVPPPCTVTFETVTDTRVASPTPGETVVKAIITNPTMMGPDGTPAMSVVYFHESVPIICHASMKGDGTSRATDSTGTVTIDEWVDPAIAQEEEATAKPSFCGGEVEELDATTFSHTATGNEIIQFTPQPNEAGVEVRDVYGDSVITLRADYSAHLGYVSEAQGGPYHTVAVKDGEGNVITLYRIHDNSKVQLVMNEEFLTIGDKEEKLSEIDYDDKKNNEFWTEDFSVNESLALDLLNKPEEKPDYKYPEELKDMANKLDISEEDLTELLLDNGIIPRSYDKNDTGKLSKEELHNYMKNHDFPPKMPDNDGMTKLVRMLSKEDPLLKTFLQRCDTTDTEIYMENMSGATQRLEELLNTLYPGDVKATDNPEYWWEANNMTFNGLKFEPFKAGENDDDIWTQLDQNTEFYMPESDSRGTIHDEPFDNSKY